MDGDRVSVNYVNLSSTPGFMRKNFKGTTRTVNDRLGTDLTLTQRLDAIIKGHGVSYRAMVGYGYKQFLRAAVQGHVAGHRVSSAANDLNKKSFRS